MRVLRISLSMNPTLSLNLNPNPNPNPNPNLLWLNGLRLRTDRVHGEEHSS
jgi:hypothetical protein